MALPPSLNLLQYWREVDHIINSLEFLGHTVSAVSTDLPSEKQPQTQCKCMNWLCLNKPLFAKTNIEPDLAQGPCFGVTSDLQWWHKVYGSGWTSLRNQYFCHSFIFLKLLGFVKLQWRECRHSSSLQFDLDMPELNKMGFDIFKELHYS